MQKSFCSRILTEYPNIKTLGPFLFPKDLAGTSLGNKVMYDFVGSVSIKV